MANNPKELGTENVRQLLISYSGPAIAAMMASALYNVIDRAFIGQGVCALAISGLAIDHVAYLATGLILFYTCHFCKV